MMQLLLFFLASFGFAFVVGHSKISLPFRQWLGGWIESHAMPNVQTGEVHGSITTHKPAVPLLGPFLVALAECPACLGFWIGLVAGMTGFVPLSVSEGWWRDGMFLAFATSGVNLLLAKWVGLI